jgi:hypothetical protein
MRDELKELKSLVRRFLKVTACVPFRTPDLCCTQDELQMLLDRMREASRPAKNQRKPVRVGKELVRRLKRLTESLPTK